MISVICSRICDSCSFGHDINIKSVGKNIVSIGDSIANKIRNLMLYSQTSFYMDVLSS
jgi:hypothetical protein